MTEPDHIREVRLELLGIAMRINTILKWLIENQDNMDDRTATVVGLLLIQIGHYGNIVHLILNHPEIEHKITNIFSMKGTK